MDLSPIPKSTTIGFGSTVDHQLTRETSPEASEADFKDNKQVLGDESLPQSWWDEAMENLDARPKFGETYEAVTVDAERIKKRLKNLSRNANEGETTNKNTIDEALEIYNAAYLLSLGRTSSSEIDMAGQKAQRAANLMLQSQIMSKKANELLAESKNILKLADIQNLFD